MEILELSNYHFNRAVFLNEIKNLVLKSGGKLVDIHSMTLSPFTIKNKNYITDDYITHYKSYISYILDNYYYCIILNDNLFFEHIYIKATTKNNMRPQTCGDTYIPSNYIRALIKELSLNEIKDLAKKYFDELKESRDTQIAVKREYNNDEHTENIDTIIQYKLKEITLEKITN